METVTLATIALLALIGTMYFVNTGRTKTARNVALLFLGLSAVLWLCGCVAPKNDNKGDIAIIIASKGTIFEINALDNGYCNMIIKTDNSLIVNIIKKDLYCCDKFKKGDRVTFSAILQPSPIMPGGIKKL